MPDRRSFLAASLGALLAACGSASTRLVSGTNPTGAAPRASDATSTAAGTILGPSPSAAATTSGSTASTAPTAPSATAVVPPVLRFSGPAVGGGTIDAATYAGRPVAFWFWAPG